LAALIPSKLQMPYHFATEGLCHPATLLSKALIRLRRYDPVENVFSIVYYQGTHIWAADQIDIEVRYLDEIKSKELLSLVDLDAKGKSSVNRGVLDNGCIY